MVGDDVDFGAAIETLTARGIVNSGDVKKLKHSGINSCTGLMMRNKNTLTDVLGLSKDKVDIIWETTENVMVARASERSDRTTSLQFPLGIKSYHLKNKIGFGSRGAIVYKAYCKDTKSTAAIKMYNQGHAANLGDASNSLSPNLLTTSSFSVNWVVMPLMPYGSLRSILYSSFPHGLPESFACFFLSEILKGMLRLHPRHVIITAGNVLVDSDGSVKFSHGSVVEDHQYNDDLRDFAKLAMELVHKNEVSSDFEDMVSTCMRRRNVSVTELISHKCFNNLVEIRGFLAALPPLEFMAVESRRIIKNQLQTVKNIGRKDLMETLIGKEKRLQELRTSIELGSASEGQKEHWKRELASCKTKVDNLKRELGQM